jgi:transglutaminase-like putative cysteine protease
MMTDPRTAIDQGPPAFVSPLEKAAAWRIFLLTAWGLLGLLFTGEVPAWLLLPALFLLPLAWMRYVRQAPVYAWFWNTALIIMMAITLQQYQATNLDAVVQFFILLQVGKIFTYRTPSDAPWVALVALFHLVATAVLTASLIFLPIYLIHLVLTASALGALAMARGELLEKQGPVLVSGYGRASGRYPSHGGALGLGGSIAKRDRLALVGMNRWLLALCLVCLLFTAFVFPMVPRLSTQRLFDNFSSAPASGAISDFSEEIQFGQFQEIGLSTVVAMYARPITNGLRPEYVRLRGVAVDEFDGRRWRRSSQPSLQMGSIIFPPFVRDMTRSAVEWQILLQPNQASHLMVPSFPEVLRLEENQTVLVDTQSGSGQLPGVPTKLFTYNVLSRHDSLDRRIDPGTTLDTMFLQPRRQETQRPLTLGERLAQATRARTQNTTAALVQVPDPGQSNQPEVVQAPPSNRGPRRQSIADRSYRQACLQVPDALNTSAMIELAQSWTEGTENNPFLMALAIEQRLKTTFQYSLTQTSQGNFIEDFLFRTRSGHCEYFATGMAIMLRLLGVPTRVANGYYSSEWNEANQAFVVRQKHAHAWVEVYLGDEVGWMTFDPTPPQGLDRVIQESVIARRIREILDSLRLQWYRNVIDFSLADQSGVRQALFSRNGLLARIAAWTNQGGVQQLADIARGGQAATWIGGGFVLFGLFVLGVTTREKIFSLLDRLRLRLASRQTTVAFYGEILRLLQRKGFHRPVGVTPREFAVQLANQYPELVGLPRITELFYKVRYAGHIPTDEDKNLILEVVREVRNKSKRISKTQ